MICLGLDPSLTAFGWVVYDSTAGTVRNQGRFKTSSKTLFIDRYLDLREKLSQLILSEKPDKIGCEYPIFNDLYSEGLYGLFLYNCEAMRTLKQDVVFFSPGQLKARAREYLGRPAGWKMQKPDMSEAAKKASSTTRSWDHNEADAFWAAYLGSRFWALEAGQITATDLTPLENRMFLKEHTYTRGKKKGKTYKSGITYREDERFFLWSKS